MRTTTTALGTLHRRGAPPRDVALGLAPARVAAALAAQGGAAWLLWPACVRAARARREAAAPHLLFHLASLWEGVFLFAWVN